ncbi:uncharacterized protein LOC124435964 [Xenia sp. Carnegie-2017]|uniref:uncharacterized protein LOC124435964 n=1 Tax=Xenia sp. Carnegie-2017 TaxID=2897299 RepID=UPI001F035CBB|nr:uncharacterized protein LOC124435964 [Xenia sp. Carnegie-2017]
MENINKDAMVEPYMFEPMPDEFVESENSDSESSSSSEVDDQIDEEFEAMYSWRKTSLSWYKCGHCELMAKTIECFCCHEKAVEYDEYDGKLNSAQDAGLSCVTELAAFNQNISASVLEIDTWQYIKESSPLGDDELAVIHKIYRHVGYRRCSRWIFHNLGKKCRRPFPYCMYKCIRGKYWSSDALYTHFKYAK